MPDINNDQNQPKQQSQQSSSSSSPNQAQSQLAQQSTQSRSSIAYNTRLPWGAIKEKLPTANITELANIERKKPGEYLLNLLILNFIQISSKKIDSLLSVEKRDRRLKDSLQRNEDPQLDKLVLTMGHVAEQSLPSLLRSLLIWHESQIHNLNYLKQQQQHNLLHQQQQQIQTDSNLNWSSSKVNVKAKQHLLQAKM